MLSFFAFLAGFLQDTQFELVIYILYFVLFVVGAKLVVLTYKSSASRVLRAFLLITGLSSTIYFLFFVFAVINNLVSGIGVTETMELLEGALYLNSLIFLISVIASVIVLNTRRSRNS
jgi:hypothetical protein